MTQPPPFDDWSRQMDHYNRRIDALASQVPMPGGKASPFYTKQLASLRGNHAEVLELIQRTQTSPDHQRADQERIIERLSRLEREIGEMERSGR